MVDHSRTIHKEATPCSLTLSRPNLALTLSKHVLKPMDLINLHYDGLEVFFSVCTLPLNSGNLKWVREGV
jgi:hypothetical protein